MIFRKNTTNIFVGFAAALSLGFVYADTVPVPQSSRQATEIVLQSLVKKGSLTEEQADAILNELQPAGVGNVYQAAKAVAQSLVKTKVWDEGRANALLAELGLTPADASSNAVRVTYVPEIVLDDLRERLKQEVLAQAHRERWGDPGAMPAWTMRMQWDGDLRLRAQFDRYESSNFPYYPNFPAINSAGDSTKITNPFLNTTEDRDRTRLRARLGVSTHISEQVDVAMRLATGSVTVPVSTNYTLGNMNNRPPILFDQVYVQARPWSWLTMSGGRVPNPWFASDLVWADDLSFDGVAINARTPVLYGVSGFATVGAFPLQEVELAADKWFAGSQLGVEWNLSRVRAKFGVAYYDYKNISGKRNAFGSHLSDNTAPQYMQKGNTLYNISQDTAKPELYALAADYKELDILGLLDVRVAGDTHAVFAADMVRNIGFDQAAIVNRTGTTIDKHVNGYLLKMSLGMPKIGERYDWQFYVGYKRVGADAVLDAFVDPDFHLGGTNAKGWIIGGGVGLAHNTFLTFRWMSADEVYGPPLSIDVGQIDLNVRF